MPDTWWAVEGATFNGHIMEKAPTARAAIVAARRALIEADRANGLSRRDAEVWVRAAQLRVFAGPWTLDEMITFETGMRWAWKICDTVVGQRSEPAAPATRDEAIRYLGGDETEQIERLVRGVYAPRDSQATG